MTTKKKLSSDWTFVYKIVIPGLWSLVTVGLTAFVIWDSHNPWTLLMLLMLLPTLILLKLNQVSYDDQNVYISNYRTRWTYELRDIRAINQGNMTGLDPFFQLEIIEGRGRTRKIEFMPRISEQINHMFTGKLTGRLLELSDKLRDIKSKSM